MYYILNETNQIIAADDNLLTVCGVSHIDELSANIALGKTTFIPSSDETIILDTDNNEETYSVTKTSLSSMLGNLTIVEIFEASEESETDVLDSVLKDDAESSTSIEAEDTELDLENIDTPDEITFGDYLASNDVDEEDLETLSDLIKEETEESISDIEESIEITKNVSDEDPLQLFEDAPIVKDVAESFTEIEKEDELFDLLSNEETQKTDDEDQVTTLDLDSEITFGDEEIKEEDTSPILIDIEEVSQKIGIEKEDYNLFLDEYIDTALTLEKDLQSVDTEKRTNALTTLSHLSDVLRIPIIGDIILDIEAASSDTIREHIESFYATLSRVTTSPSIGEEISETIELFTEPVSVTEPEVSVESPLESIEESTDEIIDNAPLELFDEPVTMTESETPVDTEPKASIIEGGFGSLSLDDVKPIHFDFQLEEAANDLSLPVELIEEFVHDFIAQAHVETKKMLEAYEKGDLDAIQKIGHLLKGASSNLRINPLSDTLYQIQFCEDSSNLEKYIKAYWGHFLSFENQINVISN